MVNEIMEKIIEKIKKNRISSTEIMDTLGKDFEYYLDVKPLISGSYVVGKVFTVHVINKSNWWIHLDLIDVPKDSIVVVKCLGENRAAFGSLVAKYILLYKQCKAIICDGNLRDAQELIKQQYPIWTNGLSSVGCFNTYSEAGEKQYQEIQVWVNEEIAVADDTGVALIPMSKHTEEYIKKLDFIEWQEDKWFECIDKGWDTFKTVCKKEYEQT